MYRGVMCASVAQEAGQQVIADWKVRGSIQRLLWATWTETELAAPSGCEGVCSSLEFSCAHLKLSVKGASAPL